MAGRPPGPEGTSIIALRLPDSLKARLDRHLDRLETQTGLKANRGTIARHALKLYLDQQDDAATGPTRPAPGRNTTQRARRARRGQAAP